MERFEFAVVVGVIAVFGLLFAILRLVFIRKRHHESFIRTGLKAVDLFAPLPRGGDILITGGEGTGSTILGYEVARRLLQHPHENFAVTFFLDAGLPDLETRTAEMDDVLPTLTNRLTVTNIGEDDVARHLPESKSAYSVIFVASDDQRFLQMFRDTIRRVREDLPSARRLTTVTVTGCDLTSDFDARIQCSRMIAKQGIYPAIDPEASHWAVYNDPSSLSRQEQVANTAANAVSELMQTIYEGAAQDDAWEYNQDATKRPALQALCFMSQPFFTAEIYTGKKGTYVPIAETVRDFAVILAGQKESIAANRFMYAESLPNE